LPCLIQVFLQDLDKEKLQQIIEQNDLMVPHWNVPYDIDMHNPLIKCFSEEDVQITTAEMLIKYILSE
jgi:hypothetical protein